MIEAMLITRCGCTRRILLPKLYRSYEVPLLSPARVDFNANEHDAPLDIDRRCFYYTGRTRDGLPAYFEE